MQFHNHANQSHFCKNGFALRLALKQRHKGTWKWPIALTAAIPFGVPYINYAMHKTVDE